MPCTQPARRRARLAGLVSLALIALAGRAEDTTPPQIDVLVPKAGDTVAELAFAEVAFDEGVTGVDAADLLVNGQPATGLQVYSPRDYGFTFPEPAPGPVTFTWGAGHGITDLASPANAFAGPGWSVTLDKTPRQPKVVISEFLADNEHGVRDDFGNRSDWIELLNLDSEAVDLNGWFLTDDAAKPAKWRFPPVILAPGGYLLLYASERNLTNPAAPLHTNFKLANGGEYLALLDPRTNVASAFAPTYPQQQADVSYGRDAATPDAVGFYPTPTPGQPNGTSGPGFAPALTCPVPGGFYTNALLDVVLLAPSGTIRYTLNGTMPTEGAAAYTGPLAINRSTVLTARVFEDGKLPGPILAQAYHLLGASVTNFSSNLPLLVINTAGRSVPEGSRIPAFLGAIEPFRGRASLQTAPALQTRAQIEIRGQSSTMFPKKAYNLELDNAAGLDAEAPLLGLPAESDWVLYAPYSDKPFLQNFLAYELHERMGHYAPRRRFVEVFIQAASGRLEYPRDYAGIYLLVEKIKVDPHRVDIARLTPLQNSAPDITGGYIIKKDKDSPGDKGFSTTGGGGFSSQYLKIHEPKPREVTTPQLNWIRSYLNQFEKALYAADWLTRTGTNHYAAYIDVDSFVDNHWMVEFAKQIDGYRLSNYMHKDRGGKLKMDPIWDWNLSFGNADYLDGANPAGWYYPQLGDNDHIWLRRLIDGTTWSGGGQGDPDFNQRIADRWSTLRTNILNSASLLARVDELAAYLDEAQVRDFRKWPRLGSYVWPNPPLYSQPTTYAGIIANLKGWIADRYTWIDAQFLRAPAFSLPPGGVTPGGRVALSGPLGVYYYTTDGTDPRAPGGGVSPGAKTYSGPIAITGNSRIVARVRSGTRWSGPAAATYVVAPPPLVVTELMYHPRPPAAGDTNDVGNFEFIELLNRGAAPLDLRGFQLSGGIQFSFATGQVATLAAGARVVVARNAAALASRHGTVTNLAGEFAGSLANEGEQLRLTGPMQETVLELKYEGDWYPAADGLGFAIVAASESQPREAWTSRTGWRTGSALDGTPGAAEPAAPDFPSVVINEVLAHTDPPLVGAIELRNLAATAADISGWYLTDDRLTPKFRIPKPTVIPAGGYAVFTESDFNPTPGVAPSFNLRASGDEVYLLSADAAGRLTGYVHGFDFGASLSNESLGRHVTSDGREAFVRQTAPSLRAANAGPKVGPVVLSEIMYHPPDVFTNHAWWDAPEFEFIELHNLGAARVPLFDPQAPTNTWRLRDAVKFTFPTNLFLEAGERILVVGFDPAAQADFAAAFRADYGVPAATRLFGPWDGKLANDRDSVELVQPDLVRFYQTNEVVTAVLVDRVDYRGAAPWPLAADGLGLSLQRVSANAFGDDPANWVAAAPTPGAAGSIGQPPVITRQPLSQSVTPGMPVTLSVETSFNAAQFQWRRDDANLPGATNAVLRLAAAQLPDAGDYQVIVYNDHAAAASDVAQVRVATPPAILQQPAGAEVREGQPVTFSVLAAGASALRYEWRHNGEAIPGGSEPKLVVAAAQGADEGDYDVLVSDDFAAQASVPVRLSVLVTPAILQQPLSQTGARGGSVTFSVAVKPTADLPVTYEWQKGGVALARHTLPRHQDFLTLHDLQARDAGDYRVVVTSPTLPAPGFTSQPAQLAVVDVPDADGDGMSDAFELAHGFEVNNPQDAAADADHDGASNLEEAIAGTDPRDAASVLRVDAGITEGTRTLIFQAVASRTYSVLYRDDVPGAPWQVLAGVPAISADSLATRAVTVSDSAPVAQQRYYRIVTPGRGGD